MGYRNSIFFIIAGIFFIGMSQTNSDKLTSIVALIAGIIVFVAGILALIKDFKKNQKK